LAPRGSKCVGALSKVIDSARVEVSSTRKPSACRESNNVALKSLCPCRKSKNLDAEVESPWRNDGGVKFLDDGGVEFLDDGGVKFLDDGGVEFLDEGGVEFPDDEGVEFLDDGGLKFLDDGGLKFFDDSGVEFLDDGVVKFLDDELEGHVVGFEGLAIGLEGLAVGLEDLEAGLKGLSAMTSSAGVEYLGNGSVAALMKGDGTGESVDPAPVVPTIGAN
jgi:hypothetical protein